MRISQIDWWVRKIQRDRLNIKTWYFQKKKSNNNKTYKRKQKEKTKNLIVFVTFFFFPPLDENFLFIGLHASLMFLAGDNMWILCSFAFRKANLHALSSKWAVITVFTWESRGSLCEYLPTRLSQIKVIAEVKWPHSERCFNLMDY